MGNNLAGVRIGYNIMMSIMAMDNGPTHAGGGLSPFGTRGERWRMLKRKLIFIQTSQRKLHIRVNRSNWFITQPYIKYMSDTPLMKIILMNKTCRDHKLLLFTLAISFYQGNSMEMLISWLTINFNSTLQLYYFPLDTPKMTLTALELHLTQNIPLNVGPQCFY